jgi:MFS family permease
LGLEKPLMQLIVSIFPLTSFIFPPLLGFYSDRFQNRLIFIISGVIGISFAFLVLSLTKDLILIVILLFFFGLSMSLSNISFALYTELVEDDKKLISYYNATIVAGWFTGAQSGGIYIDLYGIENIFIFLLLISLPTIIFVVFIRENRSLILERYGIKDDKNKNTLNTIQPVEEEQISKSIYYGLFFRNFSIKPIMPILAIIMILYLSSDTEIGFLIGINFFLQFFQMLAAGKIITKKNLKSFMITGYFLSAVTIFGFIIASNFWMFLFFQILFSFSYSMHWAATIVYIAQKTTPKNKGQILGYANASVFSGSFIGSLFFSLLLVFNPDYYIAMSFMIVFPIISMVIIYLKLK